MISYIKIYGPPILKAVRTLEKIAIDMPEVCIMDPIIATMVPMEIDGVLDFFHQIGGNIPEKRCDKIISKSGEKLGDYDFFFEWFKNPAQLEINNLIEQLDNALAPLGCRYTITTKMR